MLTLHAEAETFAAERSATQEEYITRLRPLVADALAQGDWVGVTDAAVNIFRRAYAEIDPRPVESTDPLLTAMLNDLQASLRRTRTTQPDSAMRTTQTDAIATWVSVMALNAGTEAAAAAHREEVDVEWVTMADEDVRAAHRAMRGQVRALGETFDMQGFEFNYPGQPVGPPALWINCRCSLRVRAKTDGLTAAAERPWAVVVALPAEDDPVRAIGPEEKHATLLYFGEQDVDTGRVKAALAASRQATFTDRIIGNDSLGEDEADVLMLDPDGGLPRLREALLADGYLRELTDGVDQHPTYTPHVTLGYPSDGWQGAEQVPEQITFDRLALWQGDNRWEFDMDEDDIPTSEEELENDYDPTQLEPMAIHGVLAIEGSPTGDYRNLLEGEITWRDLPVALRYTPIDNGGHDGALVVARIDRIWRDGNLLPFEGTMDDSEQASEALRLIAEGYLRGVSVDLDTVEAYANEETGNSDVIGRIAAATIVQIPAFQEAYVALGPWPAEQEDQEAEFAISEKSWSGDSSRFTIEEWKRSTLIDTGEGEADSKSRYKLPIKEPNGDLSRAAVHAAAARINQVDAPRDQIAKAKKALRSAYKRLGEEPPEVVAAASQDVEAFAPLPPDVGIPGERGKGWITHPKETSRLWKYWTRGPGAAKIAWGTPNDFYRCRRQLAKYINPIYLNRTCAEWHHDALGVWPGQHSVKGDSMDTDTLVAAATFATAPPKGWFTDPNLDGPTPLTVTEEGRVYGHVATWGQCHIGVKDSCVSAPSSSNDYAYFHTGVIDTEDGPVSVGTLAMGGGHADLSSGYRATVAHYDSTSTAAAYVHVGEDEHGIWMAGMVAPGLSDAERFTLQAAGTVSGDWRAIGTAEAQDLVAVLVVNTPGFPVARPALAASAHGLRAATGLNTVYSATVEADVRAAVRAEMARAEREKAAKARIANLRADRARKVLTEGVN